MDIRRKPVGQKHRALLVQFFLSNLAGQLVETFLRLRMGRKQPRTLLAGRIALLQTLEELLEALRRVAALGCEFDSARVGLQLLGPTKAL